MKNLFHIVSLVIRYKKLSYQFMHTYIETKLFFLKILIKIYDRRKKRKSNIKMKVYKNNICQSFTFITESCTRDKYFYFDYLSKMLKQVFAIFIEILFSTE